MRHIITHDLEDNSWLVVDTQSAHMVISIHATRHAARAAAESEERNWPARYRKAA